MIFSGDETTDVGRDTGTGVSPDYATHDNEFTGRIHWVQIDIDDNSRRPRPPHHPRGALPHRDGAPVAAEPASGEPQSLRGEAIHLTVMVHASRLAALDKCVGWP